MHVLGQKKITKKMTVARIRVNSYTVTTKNIGTVGEKIMWLHEWPKYDAHITNQVLWMKSIEAKEAGREKFKKKKGMKN